MSTYLAHRPGHDAVRDPFTGILSLPFTVNGRPACADADPEMFFGTRPTREARAICLSCPVREGCLDWALQLPEKWGVWGGLGEQARRRIHGKHSKSRRADEELRQHCLDLIDQGLTVPQVAERTGLHRTTIRRYMEAET